MVCAGDCGVVLVSFAGDDWPFDYVLVIRHLSLSSVVVIVAAAASRAMRNSP